MQLIILIISLAVVTIFGYSYLRRLRVRTDEPKFLPTSYLKRKWQSWRPRGTQYGQVSASEREHALSATNTSYNPASRDVENGTQESVDRHTSVRSVITLPAYSRSVRESEQVIGREGERAGIDTVIEYPETAETEENRREDEMESLFQIRQARRREIAERETRRQERRDARNRGDWARLEELRRDSRARASTANAEAAASTTNLSAAMLLAEHQSRGRDRRVSSVAYGDVGQVRHDGSRLRANSDESERGALLEGAAPMGEGTGRVRGTSDVTLSTLGQPHTRDRSASSVISFSSMGSDVENPVPGQATPLSSHGRPRSPQSENPASGTSNSSPTDRRFTPADSSGSDDIGDTQVPAPIETTRQSRPPDYEHLDWGQAPAYHSPQSDENQSGQFQDARHSRSLGVPTRVASRAPRLPEIGPVPSINVEVATEPNTPLTPDPSDHP